MVSNKSVKKAKKPIETTLGKAPVISKDKEPDASHLRKPIETSISGIKQVISILENATNEVKHLLMYECEIMYECKICRTIFRSLANFILHKRNFCKDKISPIDCINNNDTFKVSLDPPKKAKRETKSPLGRVIDKLNEIERVRESAKQYLSADLSSEPGHGPIKVMDDREENAANFNELVLEKIDSNRSATFQTLVNGSSAGTGTSRSGSVEFMKTEVMEVHKKLESDVPVLDSEGKICGFTSSKLHQRSLFPKSQLKCMECNNTFATQKSLTNHVKYIHNPTRILYVCPTCKDTFANPWCVYRHLLKVHRMTNKQVRRMREQVHNSWIQRGEEATIQKKKATENNENLGNSDHQWINDIEGDNDFQMCAGCGKHFERKAALHSHSQMCAKRLEVCNNIKENAKKKNEEEHAEKVRLEKIENDKATVKGASKRKGKTILKYQRKTGASEICNGVTNLDQIKGCNNNDGDVVPKMLPSDPSEMNKIDSIPPKDVSKHGSTEVEDEVMKLPLSVKNEAVDIEQAIVKEPIIEQTQEAKNTNSCNLSDDVSIKEVPVIHSDVGCRNTSKSLGEKSKIIKTNRRLRIVGTRNRPCKTKPTLLRALSTSTTSSSNRDDEKCMSSRSSSFLTCRSNSSEDPVCISSSDESSQDVIEVPSITNVVSCKKEPVEEEFSPDLFSPKVTFEMFCKKISTTQKTDSVPKNVRKRKRMLDTVQESSDVTCDNDDDVIFVSENVNSSNTSDDLENNGFAGFSSEEASQSAFGMDFSTMSYNNPLKARKNNPTQASTLNIPVSQKEGCAENVAPENDLDLTTTTTEYIHSKLMKKEANFISKAAPYMDNGTMSCIPCGLSFESCDLLIYHMSAHFSWFRFQCSKCSFVTFSKYDCVTHACKDHDLPEDSVSSYVLPLPSWKTELMAHEFQLLKDSNDLRGKHTDEKICSEENSDQDATNVEEMKIDKIFQHSPLKVLSSGPVEEGCVTKRNKLDAIIDIQDIAEEFYILPEPFELTMPADVSEVFKKIQFNDDEILVAEKTDNSDILGDESNDDWGLSELCSLNVETTPKKSDEETTSKDDAAIVPPSLRPCRIRTKAKQNDDFLYYDSDVNSVLKITELVKRSPPKQRPDGVVNKPRASTKVVPTSQKKKS